MATFLGVRMGEIWRMYLNSMHAFLITVENVVKSERKVPEIFIKKNRFPRYSSIIDWRYGCVAKEGKSLACGFGGDTFKREYASWESSEGLKFSIEEFKREHSGPCQREKLQKTWWYKSTAVVTFFSITNDRE